VKEINTLRDQLEFVLNELNAGIFNDVEQVAGLIVQIPIRDAVMRTAYDQPENRPALISAISGLLDVVDTAYDLATINTLIAGIYWLDGNKGETEQHLGMALEHDSTYSLARLLNVAITHGVPAGVWADSLKAVSLSECLAGAE
jgi:hypothetical protein